MKSTSKDPNNPVFTCDGCRNYICGDCSDLSASEIKCRHIKCMLK